MKDNKLNDEQDEVVRKGHGTKVGFNGRGTISWKVKHAIKEKIGGVMIWEVGQDCRFVRSFILKKKIDKFQFMLE